MFSADITLFVLLFKINPLFDFKLTSPVNAEMLLFIITDPFEVTLISGLSKPWNFTLIVFFAVAYSGS